MVKRTSINLSQQHLSGAGASEIGFIEHVKSTLACLASRSH
jgi:hypothetical protein